MGRFEQAIGKPVEVADTTKDMVSEAITTQPPGLSGVAVSTGIVGGGAVGITGARGFTGLQGVVTERPTAGSTGVSSGGYGHHWAGMPAGFTGIAPGSLDLDTIQSLIRQMIIIFVNMEAQNRPSSYADSQFVRDFLTLRITLPRRMGSTTIGRWVYSTYCDSCIVVTANSNMIVGYRDLVPDSRLFDIQLREPLYTHYGTHVVVMDGASQLDRESEQVLYSIRADRYILLG